MYRARIFVVLATALLVAPLAHAEELHFVDESVVRNTTIIDCSSLPGTVPITPETRSAARQAGIPDSVSCWNPKDINVGAAVGEAKVYLRSMLCGSDRDGYGGAGADGTITGLNAKFAVCAAAFIKAASAQMSLCIREGFRTEAKQKEYFDRYKSGGGIACDPSSKTCEHPSGIAIDINTTRESDYARLWASAPDYGLTFYLRERDKYHFVPAKEGCIARANVISNPAANVPISTYDFPAQAPNVNPFQNPNLQFLQPLMQQLAQSLRPAPNMPQTPTITASQQIPNTTYPTTPSIPSTPSTPVTTPTTPLTPGTTSTGTPSTTDPSPLLTTPSTSPVTISAGTSTPSAPQKSDQPSWIDIILGIAQFDSKPTTIIPETTPLNPALTHTSGQLQPSTTGNATGTRPTSTQTPTPTPGAYQGQTFTSSDLSGSPSSNAAEIAERSRILIALAQLRAGLERFLGITADPRSIQNASRWIPQ